MLKKQIWLVAVAMALMTTAASAITVPMYRTVMLPGPASSGRVVQSIGTAAITGQEGGVFVFGRYSVACLPGREPTMCTSNQTHAALWAQNGTPGFTSLNPQGYFSTSLTGMAKGTQVGYGYAKKPEHRTDFHAIMWFGSAKSIVDLNQPNYLGSIANAVDGARVVGTGYVRTNGSLTREVVRPHALMWVGFGPGGEQPSVFVDLNPKGAYGSEAFAVSGAFQGGYVYETPTSRHAYIWNGSSTLGRDYHPAGYFDSYIIGIHGSQAVGAVTETKNEGAHAYMWDMRTGAFGVDLHNAGFTETVAAAASNGKQVGWGELGATGRVPVYHALVWTGTAKSCIDLHRFLPAGYISSKALAIAPDGSVVGVAYDKHGIQHAVLWVQYHR